MKKGFVERKNLVILQNQLQEMTSYFLFRNFSFDMLSHDLVQVIQNKKQLILELSDQCYLEDPNFMIHIESYYDIFCSYLRYSDSRLFSSTYREIVLDWMKKGYVPFSRISYGKFIRNLLLSKDLSAITEVLSSPNFPYEEHEDEMIQLWNQEILRQADSSDFKEEDWANLTSCVYEIFTQRSYQKMLKNNLHV